MTTLRAADCGLRIELSIGDLQNISNQSAIPNPQSAIDPQSAIRVPQ